MHSVRLLPPVYARPFRLPTATAFFSLFLVVSSVSALPSLPFPVRDDYEPAIAIDSSGAPWVVWVSSFADTSTSGNGDAIHAARWTGSGWDTAQVSEGRGRYLDPQIAADAEGILVSWVELQGTNSEIKIRRFANGWSDETTPVPSPEADFAPAVRSAGAAGGFWLAWQRWTGSSYDVFLARVDADTVAEEHLIADSPANDGEPDVAVAPNGTVWIAWESIRNRHMEICLRSLLSGILGPSVRATNSQMTWSRYPSIGVDPSGNLWVAYYRINREWRKFESSDPEPSDLGSVRLLGWDGASLAVPHGTPSGSGRVPRPSMEEVGYYVPSNPIRVYGYRPHLLIDGRGRLWVFSKMNGYFMENGYRNQYWGIFGVYYEGTHWSDVPRVFLSRGAHFWNAPAAALDGEGTLWLAWTKDRRDVQPIRDTENILGPDSDVRVDTFLVGFGGGQSLSVTGHQWPSSWNPGEARTVPRFEIQTSEGTYGVYFGENHRHTCDFSYDGIWDYPFEETFSAAYERVGYDWYAPADHVEWWSPLVWNLVAKWIDLRHIPGQFVTFPGFEKAGRTGTWGGRGDQNALYLSSDEWSSRDALVTTPFRWLDFYANFGNKDVLVIPHHPVEKIGTGFTIYDELIPPGGGLPNVLRLVEIFQTTRGSSEYPGCPLEHRPPVVQPDTGWVQSAWGKGLRLGIVSAADHNPGNGFTAVLAENGTREAIFEALRARRCYGTSYSRKIFLDFRIDDHLMGEEHVAEEPPTISYRVVGTRPLLRVQVLKNGNPDWYVSMPVGSMSDSASFVDMDPVVAGTTAYYTCAWKRGDKALPGRARSGSISTTTWKSKRVSSTSSGASNPVLESSSVLCPSTRPMDLFASPRGVWSALRPRFESTRSTGVS